MEDALRVNQHRHDRDTDQRVLILVLMEDALRDTLDYNQATEQV